ncbi:USP9X, partial [Symbiodinium sp. KB8]
LYPTSKWAGQLDALRRQFQRVIASLCALSSQSLQTLPFVRACVNDPPGFMPLESNILDQNDANEFFSVLVDRLGEALPRPSPHLEDMVGDSPEPVPLLLSSGTGERVGAAPDLVTSIVGGAFVHQIISTDPAAPFYSERREPFVCLSVDVKDSSDLASCLRSFVADDLLTGDNAFRADDYDSKIDVRKRCVLSELPDVLVVHLKRFDLDFTTFERVKLNNTVSFPDELDLWPFTLAGAPGSTDVVDQIRGLREHIASSLATQEAAQSAAGAGAAASAAAAAPSTARPHDVVALRARLAEVDELARRLATSASTTSREHCKYRLSGVLIHIGTATAGHYFSFVRERQCDVLARLRGMPRGSSVLPAPSSDDGEGSDVVEAGEWLLFNDESVERVSMGDAQRASQWFGSARSTQSAFMLFYDRQASAAAPAGPSASKPDRARRALADERPAQRQPPTSPPGSGCRAVPVAAPAGMTLDAAELTGCSRRAMTLATGTAADALGCSILAVLAANLHDTEAAFAAACGSAAGSGAAPPPAPSVPLREDIEPLMDAATRMLVAGEPHSIDANALTSGILANAHALALAWPLHGAGCLCVRGVRRATALLNGPAGRWLPAADAAAIHRLLSRSMVRGSSKQLGLHTPSNVALRRAARVAAAVATSLQGDPTALRPSVRRELEQALLARGGTLSGSVGHCQLARGILSVGSIPRRISATARLVVSRLQGTAMSGVQRLLDGGAPSRWRAATGMLARVARALNAVACAAGVTLRPPTEWFLLSPQPSVETEAPATPASPALDSRAAAPRLAGGLLPKASAVRERLGLGGSSGAAGSSGSGACESSADLLDVPLGGSASSSASSDRLRSGYSATVALSEIAELAVAVLADAMGGRNDSICLGAGIATALFQGGPVAAAAGLRHRLPELVVAIHFANAPNVPTELDRFCHGGLLFFNETQKPQVVDPISGGDSAAVGEGALGLSDVLPSLPISVAAEFGGVATRTPASALRFFNPLPVPLEQAALRPADSPIMRDVLQRTVALAIRAGRVHDSAVCVDGDGALRDEAQRSFDGWQPPPRSPQTAPSSLPWPISAAAGAGAAEAAPAGPAKCGLSPGRHPAVASSAAVSAGEWLRAASMAGATRAALRVLSHSCERWRAGDVAALRARLRQHAASSFSRAGGLVARAGSDRFRADRRRVGDGVLRGVAVASTLAELEAM